MLIKPSQQESYQQFGLLPIFYISECLRHDAWNHSPHTGPEELLHCGAEGWGLTVTPCPILILRVLLILMACIWFQALAHFLPHNCQSLVFVLCPKFHLF